MPRFDLTNPYNINVQYGDTRGVVNPNATGWFGPLDPMAPIAPKDVDGRQWDFPAGWNLYTRPRANEPVTFSDLRGLADGYDFLRLVIETRKDQIDRISWNIKFRDAKANRKENAGQDKRVLKAEAFFRKPDGEHNWNEWLRMVLEDLFVLDAPSIYVERNRLGEMMYLHPLDGATIKRVIDDWGRTPRPFEENSELIYPVAYQQILKGFPALDYTTRDLIYRPRNIRTHKAYGYGPVEQIMMTVNIALRRQIFHLQYFTEGNIPEALIGVPDGWTPDQIKQFQSYWDGLIAGDTAQRRHAKFIPGGMAKTFIHTKEAELKNTFDEWLARIVCFCFSISPLSFVNISNRSVGETQKEQGEEEGLSPIKAWVKNLIDGVLADEFDAADLEFAWGDDEQIDPETEKNILTGYAEDAVYTINQIRAKLGEDPHPDPAANKPMLKTATGWVPLETYDEKPEAATGNGSATEPDGSSQPQRDEKPNAATTEAA